MFESGMVRLGQDHGLVGDSVGLGSGAELQSAP